jgi:hypothetical protein
MTKWNEARRFAFLAMKRGTIEQRYEKRGYRARMRRQQAKWLLFIPYHSFLGVGCYYRFIFVVPHSCEEVWL